MADLLEYMKFSLNVYAASDENQIGVPLGWTRTSWQPASVASMKCNEIEGITRKTIIARVGRNSAAYCAE